MARSVVTKNPDGTLSVDRFLTESSCGGVAVRLIGTVKGKEKNLGLQKGYRVRITQSQDGKRFYGEVVEDD
jgi:hypothetical protein